MELPKVKVEKLTDVSLLQRANSFTTGRDSHMTLHTAYRYGHSPIRTQLFWIELTNIPLFVASQLVRSHVGIQYYQRTKRTDRGGEDFRKLCQDWVDGLENVESGQNEDWMELIGEAKEEFKTLPERFDRYAPTDLAFICNAEALINMAHKRLCFKASAETRALMTLLTLKVADVDFSLAPHLVPQCVYRGGICPEPKSCKFIESESGRAMLDVYKKLFE